MLSKIKEFFNWLSGKEKPALISKDVGITVTSSKTVTVTYQASDDFIWLITKRQTCNTLPLITHAMAGFSPTAFYSFYDIERGELDSIIRIVFDLMKDIVEETDYKRWTVGIYHRPGQTHPDIIFSSEAHKERRFIICRLVQIRVRNR